MTIVPMLRVGMQFVTLCVTHLQSGETAGVTGAQACISYGLNQVSRL
ncbi:hypothetical protein ALQ57_101729 [Pseudomonas amygdali pv. hibisci]|uniref:Uncharacterized protein n=1 Tax=Pseudomonas amygdali pv. hibisci TaxID=251723 RepID=A0AB34U7A7_PSEA0|nr:hypothetical protein ALO51_102089 [Pseudomonas amygdali]KPX54827.1 hypothetical protein ALO67_101702 [Pseudomonas amygdali pv. hibisci]RMN52587.1 hypothetical protein ALQ57_101729 [Pseudomonas amygdali pv. hibisci]